MPRHPTHAGGVADARSRVRALVAGPHAHRQVDLQADPHAGAAAGGWVPGPDAAADRGARDEGEPPDPDAALPQATDPDAALPEATDPDAGLPEPQDSDAALPEPPDTAGQQPTGSVAKFLRRRAWQPVAEQWLPEPLREARIDPGRRGGLLLSLIAALAAVIAAIGVWWARPQAAPVPRPDGTGAIRATEIGGAPDGASGRVPPGGRGATGSAAAGAHAASDRTAHGSGRDTAERGNNAAPVTAARSGPILVSVTGRVRHPGVVRVPAGARVADAITAAGGALDDDDLTGLNLAAHLSDGDSVVVAGADGSVLHQGPAPGGVDPDVAATDAPTNLNTADAATLQALPGVGPVTAEAIIAYRQQHGPFTDIEQLQAVSGIGPATVARLAAHVTT